MQPLQHHSILSWTKLRMSWWAIHYSGSVKVVFKYHVVPPSPNFPISNEDLRCLSKTRFHYTICYISGEVGLNLVPAKFNVKNWTTFVELINLNQIRAAAGQSLRTSKVSSLMLRTQLAIWAGTIPFISTVGNLTHIHSSTFNGCYSV